MNANMLEGELLRLTAEEPAASADAFARWSHDSEYLRLLDSSPANQFSVKQLIEWIEKEQKKDPPAFYAFQIRSLEDNRPVGFIGLDGTAFPHGEMFVGIGLGERELWGKGFGTDAMKVILRFAFQELNLRRVSLNTFEYNPRAIRSYEKAGFRYEGRARKYLGREGKRWDLIYMGILREEWLAGCG